MSIDAILGPMFAGKSLEMLTRMTKYYLAKYKCLIIRSRKDTRYTDDANADLTACTHNKISASAIPAQFADTIAECMERITREGIQVIGIDEGQFFSDIASACDTLATEMGKIVIVAALDGDYGREMFPNIAQLVPKCDSIKKLKSVCSECNKMCAIFSSLRKSSKVIWKDEFLVGGDDLYQALCRECYAKHHATVAPKVESTTKN